MPHTLKEIAEHFPDYPIMEVGTKPRFIISLSNAQYKYDNGLISDLEWCAYQAIWRNSVFRYSHECSSWEF